MSEVGRRTSRRTLVGSCTPLHSSWKRRKSCTGEQSVRIVAHSWVLRRAYLSPQHATSGYVDERMQAAWSAEFTTTSRDQGATYKTQLIAAEEQMLSVGLVTRRQNQLFVTGSTRRQHRSNGGMLRISKSIPKGDGTGQTDWKVLDRNVEAFSDVDWCRDMVSRFSMSVGVLTRGMRCLKAWAKQHQS